MESKKFIEERIEFIHEDVKQIKNQLKEISIMERYKFENSILAK